MHVGSQILDVEPFARSVAPVAALGEFPIYDLGGGLGARYTYADEPPTVAAYLDALVGAAREQVPSGAELIIEPGRSMVASTATTLYRVQTVKRGARTFVAVDGGMGDNLEVALFDQRFEAAIPDRVHANGGESVTVVGRHCESGDVLIDEIALPDPRVGDLLAVPVTGDCFTMANNYNGVRRIRVVFASDGAARLVVSGARPGPTCSRATRPSRRNASSPFDVFSARDAHGPTSAISAPCGPPAAVAAAERARAQRSAGR